MAGKLEIQCEMSPENTLEISDNYTQCGLIEFVTIDENGEEGVAIWVDKDKALKIVNHLINQFEL